MFVLQDHNENSPKYMMVDSDAAEEQICARGFDNLPTEIILMIFSYIPDKELFVNCRQVSRRWEAIASDATLYKYIEASPELTTYQVSLWIDIARNMRVFRMYNRSDAGRILRKLASARPPELEELVIENCRGFRHSRNIPSNEMCKILKRCPYFNRLVVMECLFTSSKFYEILGTRDILLKQTAGIDASRIKKFNISGIISSKQINKFVEARKTVSHGIFLTMSDLENGGGVNFQVENGDVSVEEWSE